MLAGRLEGHLRAGGSSPFPSMAMCEPAWGPWGWGPWVSVTTSSLELGVCRQACPAHILLQVVAGRVMPRG